MSYDRNQNFVSFKDNANHENELNKDNHMNKDVQDEFLLIRDILPREKALDDIFLEFSQSLDHWLPSDLRSQFHKLVQQYIDQVLQNILSRHRLKMHVPAASFPLPFVSSASRPSSRASTISSNRSHEDTACTEGLERPNELIKELFLDVTVPLLEPHSISQHPAVSTGSRQGASVTEKRSRADMAMERRVLQLIFDQPSTRFEERIVDYLESLISLLNSQIQERLEKFNESVKVEFRNLTEDIFQQYLERKRFIEYQHGVNVDSMRDAMSKKYLFGRQQIQKLQQNVAELTETNTDLEMEIMRLKEELSKCQQKCRQWDAANLSLRTQIQDLIERSRYTSFDRIVSILEGLGVPLKDAKALLWKKNAKEAAKEFRLDYENTISESNKYYAAYEKERGKVEELEEKLVQLRRDNYRLNKDLKSERTELESLRKEHQERTEALARLEMETFGYSTLKGTNKEGLTITQQLERAKQKMREMAKLALNKDDENGELVKLLHQLKMDLLGKEAESRERESVKSRNTMDSLNVPVGLFYQHSGTTSSVHSNNMSEENVVTQDQATDLDMLKRKMLGKVSQEHGPLSVRSKSSTGSKQEVSRRHRPSARFGNLYHMARLGDSDRYK